ncbi:MAG: AMP-binding protein, partial [Acidobacteria bacterium]|nr:AMP-binding protein [Acidobacteriota bacterium]
MAGRNYDKLAAAADQNVKEKEFWLKQLAGEPVKSCFPYDKRNKAAAEHDFERVKLELSGKVLTRLTELSKRSDVKLHMVLTAVLAVLLQKYTGNHDIILGTPIYKQEIEIEFINTVLTLRLWVPGHLNFKDLLLEVKQVILDAAANQNYPLEILLEQLGITYSGTDDFPLFDTAILHENIHQRNYLENIRCNVLFIFNGSGEDVKGVIEYNPALFDKISIERISNHFQRLLEELVFNVDNPISNIDMMSDEEKKQVLSNANDTGGGFQFDKLIYESFAEQVFKTPNRIAAVGEEFLHDLQLSYGELNKRANQLAHLLRDKEIRPGTVVGLMVEKSLELLVGIWGILKAGGAYLPIDLAYPRWRIEYILKESGAGILLTYAPDILPIKMEELPGIETINILSPGIYQGNGANLNSLNRENDAAYIIYTSGSTGKPKGIIAEHRNLAAYLYAFYREFELGAHDTALQQASYSFDVFVEEVYPVLLKGGKTIICPKYVIMDMKSFYNFICKHDITFISVSPLLLNEIDKLEHTGSIKIFISGGDVLKKEYIQNLLTKENVSVYNTYGPTETTVCAAYYRCIPGDSENLPIGKPITNYCINIVNRNGRILPIGVPGELWITGPGVTRGYLNNPELTADRFKRNVISQWSFVNGKFQTDNNPLNLTN